MSPDGKLVKFILSKGSLGLGKDNPNMQIFSLFGFTYLLIPKSPSVTTTVFEERKKMKRKLF